MPFNQAYLTARDRDNEDRIVGCAGYIIIGDSFFNRCWALVENVYVTESYRQNGIASKLMRTIENLVFKGEECEFLKLTTRKELGKKLYRSLGYEEGSSFYKSRH